jgi:hypothetical protein
MRTESAFGTMPVEPCSDGVDEFGDDVRLEKIDRLRRCLAENTYEVSAQDLARKIIDHMMQPVRSAPESPPGATSQRLRQ